MRTRDEHKEAAIREKAIEMIVQEGFDGLSMQKLAKAANISPATIYIYYKNREDLLNQLFDHVQQIFADVALKGFTPELSFEDGLWLQWKNRLEFMLKYPTYIKFYEQFLHSPLVNHNDVELSEFKENMHSFVMNAIQRGEIAEMEPEIFWAQAYGAFYTLTKFHLQEKTLMGKAFVLTDAKLKQAFDMVIRSFQQ